MALLGTTLIIHHTPYFKCAPRGHHASPLIHHHHHLNSYSLHHTPHSTSPSNQSAFTSSSSHALPSITLHKTSSPTNAPQSLRWFLNPKGEDDGGDKRNGDGDDDSAEEEGSEGETAVKGTILAGLLLLGFVGGFSTVGYVYREQVNAFLTQFSGFIEGYGPAGYALFVAVYAGLEVAASISFLIARYFARDRILKLVEGNKKFLAIDKAIGENGFRVVTLLRLSPLLPFSLANYLYGLTSVKFVPYVLGSWLGMLPGSWAYVSAGAFGRAILQEESDVGLPGGNGQLLTIGLGLLATALAAAYVTRLAKDAVKDIE